MLVGEEFKSPFVGIFGAVCDHKLLVQFQQLEIGPCDAADDGYHDRAPTFLGGHEVRARGFVHPADAAPQVNFPEGFKAADVAVASSAAVGHWRAKKLVATTVGLGSISDLRQELGLRLGLNRPGLIYSRERDSKVVVVGEGNLNQVLESRVFEDTPPR